MMTSLIEEGNPRRAPKVARCTLIITFAAALFSLTLVGCRQGKPGALDRSGYHVRNGAVWYLTNWTSAPFVVAEADTATFQFPLPHGTEADFARDAKHVFLSGRVIPGADPATFEIVDPSFTRDARQVYFGYEVFCDDPAHFSRVSINFVKNSRSVFLITQRGQGEVVSQDSAGFRELSNTDYHSFCADSTQVFVNGNLIPGAQPASFKILGGGYARDATQSFYFDRPMPASTDMTTLEPLAGGYAKDSHRVYYLGKVLVGADAATFEITDPRWPKAKDKHRSYEQGEAKALVP